jgi:hypothetical protein
MNAESKEGIMKKINLVLGICLALMVVAAGCGSGDSGSSVKIDAKVGVSSAAALTEAHVDGLVNSMKIMVLTNEVRSCDWDTMKGLLSEFERDSIPLVAWFALPNGTYYTMDAGLVAANLSDRSYFPRVMSGEVTIGDLVVSKSTGRESMVIAVPVKENGNVIGALGVSVYLDNLSRSITDDLDLPSDVFFAAVNASGTIALHSNTSLIMGNSSALGDLSEKVVSTQSPLLGWTFYLGFTK